MPVPFGPKSLGETARSISKARMSVKSRALVLIHMQKRFEKSIRHDTDQGENKIRLTLQVKNENRYKLEVPQ